MIDGVEKNPRFFNDFAHSLIVEEGERPILELVKAIEYKQNLDEVANLIWLKDGQVKINEKKDPLKLNDMPVQSLAGFNLEKYITPEIILPVQASRGCYWKKCTFCDHDFGQTYNVKNVDKIVSELKHIKQTYGVSHFEFVDEAIGSGVFG
ncbi:MAG: hypothetical protein MZU97_02605 [Bacillus subtilis]|nr:hypothetical protein [Bacillus subtilis]